MEQVHHIPQNSGISEASPSDFHIYPTPLLGQDMTQGQLLGGV